MSLEFNSVITGTGAALPEERITNYDLEQMVDTSDEWIVSRTGIRERRKLEKGLSNADLVERAARQALDNAGLEPDQLDLIVVATVTPDYLFPATSCLVQSRLGALRAVAFDLSAGCTGFIFALSVAHQYLQGGVYRNALVVGADILTRITDWEDRNTCVLFGDGAGAVVLQPVPKNSGRGLTAFELSADGRGADLLIMPGGGSACPASFDSVRERLHYLKMNGNEIFKFAVRVVEETTFNLLRQAGRQPDELKYLFLHQANLRIIESARKRLQLPPERVPVSIDRYGNMSSATIPILLHEEAAAGKIEAGDLVAMVAFGAGLTWGGLLMTW